MPSEKRPIVEVIKTEDVDALDDRAELLRGLVRAWREEAAQLRARPLDGRSFLALVTDTVAGSIDEARALALEDAAEALEAIVGGGK